MNYTKLILLFLLTFSSVSFAGDKLDMSDPDDAFTVWAKLQCNLEAGKPVLWWCHGKMYSRRSGEKDTALFNVQGMNVRQCHYKVDDVRGPGIRWTSREILLFLDPATDEVLKTWKNPYTGETVDVFQVFNDPVNTRGYIWARDENGEPTGIGMDLKVFDDLILDGGGAARLFYTNPLAGDYQEYIGGTYHAMELGAFSANTAQGLSPDTTTIDDAMLSWGRISKWLPWMKMGDREGVVVFNTAGMRLQSYAELPDVLRNEIEATYPIYREPPPIDDDRPNETSWVVFKRLIEEQRAQQGATSGAEEH